MGVTQALFHAPDSPCVSSGSGSAVSTDTCGAATSDGLLPPFPLHPQNHKFQLRHESRDREGTVS